MRENYGLRNAYKKYYSVKIIMMVLFTVLTTSVFADPEELSVDETLFWISDFYNSNIALKESFHSEMKLADGKTQVSYMTSELSYNQTEKTLKYKEYIRWSNIPRIDGDEYFIPFNDLRNHDFTCSIEKKDNKINSDYLLFSTKENGIDYHRRLYSEKFYNDHQNILIMRSSDNREKEMEILINAFMYLKEMVKKELSPAF